MKSTFNIQMFSLHFLFLVQNLLVIKKKVINIINENSSFDFFL